MDERERIARDLHDTVIQRLFAAGLGLQSLCAENPVLRGVMDEQTRQIDAAITDLRSAVSGLAHSSVTTTLDVRHRVTQLLKDLTRSWDVTPRVIFLGSRDVVLQTALADDIVAVVREGLSNIRRHAKATRGDVSIDIDEAMAKVIVVDDGVGVAPDAVLGGGTRNLADRARLRGGSFEVARYKPHGTRIHWTVPVPARLTR